MRLLERAWASLGPTNRTRWVMVGLLAAYLIALTVVVVIGGHLWFLVVAPFVILAMGEVRRQSFKRAEAHTAYGMNEPASPLR